MEERPIDRLKALITWLIEKEIIKSRKDLADKIGYSNAAFSRLYREDAPLTQKFLDALKKFCPSINTNWLISGEGSMINVDEFLPQDMIVNGMKTSMDNCINMINKYLDKVFEMPIDDNVTKAHLMASINHVSELARSISYAISSLGARVPITNSFNYRSVIMSDSIKGDTANSILSRCESIVSESGTESQA